MDWMAVCLTLVAPSVSGNWPTVQQAMSKAIDAPRVCVTNWDAVNKVGEAAGEWARLLSQSSSSSSTPYLGW